MRTCTDATKAIIASQVAAQGSYRYDGFAPALEAAIWDALHDKPMSLARERRMCKALGIEAPPNEYAVPECPGCGGAPHVAREGCHGNGGTAVVLADGETVRKTAAQRTRPVVRRPWMGAELSVEMDAAGVTDATVRWLVTRHIYMQELAGHAPALEVT